MRRLAGAVLACGLFAALPLQGAAPAGRPQLDDADAARHTVAAYLAQGAAPWWPAPPSAEESAGPDAVVAPDGSGTHRSLQAALDAAPARGTSAARRHVIALRPGRYDGPLCLKDKAPLRLVGSPGDAAAVQIVGSRYNGQAWRAGIDPALPCQDDPPSGTVGTPGSATLVIASDDVQLAHLSVVNDAMAAVRDGIGYPPGAGESGGAQGVALLVQADRVLLDQVRLLGHQDTLFVRRPPGRADTSAARVLVRHSLVAGDVDFVFGDATLVITDSTLLSRSGRRGPGEGGHVLAPSTRPADRLGLLVTHSRLLAEPGVADSRISLGRAWDAGVPPGAWQAGASPNGQALVRDSALGPHLGGWAASTSRRPFSATGPQANRLAEYRNRPADRPGQPLATEPTPTPEQDAALALRLARQGLAPGDGWAAAGTGTRGGADALPADIHRVHDRASLAAALAPHPVDALRPRIVLLHGRIDLSVDDAGRPLGAEDFRDPAFDWAAFARAYDPATWGRRPPAGPLEEARRRSARRQAERVVLRVPSRTTLMGVGAGAHLLGGMLLLEQVQDVIVRNLRLSDAYDHFPAWDPADNDRGEWNSEYDNLSLRGAQRVWIDHCTFDDGDRPDAAEPVLLGARLQRHDGLLDITRQSDLVTVSWNHFRDHAKTSLVGGSDNARDDDGRLRVTFHHNLWQDVAERAPRVRFGQVHLYNNLHLATPGAAHGLNYSIGIGLGSRIVADSNVWITPPDVPARRLLRWFKGERFVDRGSLHNGMPVDLLGVLRDARPGAAPTHTVDWQPTLHGQIDPAERVADLVRASAGAGRLALGR